MQRQMERVNKEENKMMKRKRRQWARRVKCLWVMAFIIKEPDRREMEWSLPSSLLALLFLPCSSRSVCWPSRLYLLWPVLSRRRSPLLRPPSSSRDLLLSSWRRSLICYIQKRRGGEGSWSWRGGICKVETVYRAQVWGEIQDGEEEERDRKAENSIL